MFSSELGALRLARAFGFAIAAFGLSVAAHVMAGGTPPSVTASLVLGGATLWVSLFLTGQRRGSRSIVAAMGLLQLLLHQALMMSAAGSRCAALDAAGSHLHTLGAEARS
ncbi:MAG TPA: hypothetical protein VGN48_01195, partial [Pedococcus sp.]|nr:hypothetical protein [Pedococcus sp.]